MRGISGWLVVLVVGVAGAQTLQESLAKLTPEERAQFDAAGKDFNADRFAQALPVYKALAAAHPGDPLLAKMEGESAADTGDLKLAETVVSAVEAQHPDDWQAAGIMARVYAESGDAARRDAEIAKLADLYKRGLTPKGLTQYPVEKVKVGDKQLVIFNSFEPWGNFKVYNYARLFDKDGKLLQRMTLESSDMDQTFWAKQHPKEAAAGGRMFSYDGYVDGGTNAQGQRMETHATYGFLDARPTYEEVRAKFIAIAGGKGGTMSSNTHLNQ